MIFARTDFAGVYRAFVDLLAIAAKMERQAHREVLGKSSLTISRKPVGAWLRSSAVDSEGRTIWIVDAHRDDGNRFVVHADEKLTAFWN